MLTPEEKDFVRQFKNGLTIEEMKNMVEAAGEKFLVDRPSQSEAGKWFVQIGSSNCPPYGGAWATDRITAWEGAFFQWMNQKDCSISLP